MSKKTKLTPMMAQYRRIKGELTKDTLLLFRLGDFYEMFFEDAQEGSQILNISLTKRGSTPMCGIPFHAASTYLTRILKAGRKVAICEQVEEAVPGKLVKREVTQILSPGTHFDDRLLSAEKNNFLAAVYCINKTYGLAVADLTTGNFRCTELSSKEDLVTELERLRPAEIIFPSEDNAIFELISENSPNINGYDDWVFATETAQFTVLEHFKVSSLDGFGLKNRIAAIGAAGAIVHYLKDHLRRDLSHFTTLSCYQPTDFLSLDSTTLRHLEILEPLHRDAPRNATLYGAINQTNTPMGARCLRDWLTQPLSDCQAIHQRQDAIQTLLGSQEQLGQLRQRLKDIRDLERTIGRLSIGSGNGRDLLALRTALEQIPPLKQLLSELDPAAASESETLIPPAVEENPTAPQLETLNQELKELPAVIELIARAIVDEPPLTLRDGGLIRDGFDDSLDELHSASRDGRTWVAQMQQQEIERTGIPSLKVRFNSVFGYYIEVTKSNLDKVPEEYIRKQTIANGERYITPELKEIEGKILGAEERSQKLEYELFQKVREETLAWLKELQQSAAALAQIDVLCCFAEVARLNDYCRPSVGNDGVLDIQDGRHPVLEQNETDERFVPNDVRLDHTDQQICLITGPNMAGKSTYIRQVALLTLLTHTGSFIPAKTARVDLVDRIFTRIGASDDLARGQSTFMVEMCETANILNNGTTHSLVILDEIGRGTSTFDGLSLAWSIAEYLHNQVGAKTLFATHYHELTELAARLPRVKNFNVAVREWNDEIVFLRKIVEGGTDKSYGIQVARLAGVPKAIIDRSKQILGNLEGAELNPEGKKSQPSRHRAEREKLQNLAPAPQLDLFTPPPTP